MIDLYNIKHNPKKVDFFIDDLARSFTNTLYILFKGNSFEFSEQTRDTLRHLANKILFYLDKD